MDWRLRLPEKRDLLILALLCLLPLSPYLALNWLIVAHFVLAGVASHVMGRGLRMSRIGALMAVRALAFSGFMMAQLTKEETTRRRGLFFLVNIL